MSMPMSMSIPSAGGQPQKPRGRTNPYAKFVQSCRAEQKMTRPGERIGFADFARICAQRWKAMSDMEKQHFRDIAAREKARFEFEMKAYAETDEYKKRRRKRKKKNKDPYAPKKSLSPFFWFAHDERQRATEMNPDFRVGQIAKVLGRLWAQSGEEVKQKYKAIAQRDKARYQREMMAYNNQFQQAHQLQQQHQQHQQH